ncbi:efflux RND transporter permease subunit [Enterobacter hormaechei]
MGDIDAYGSQYSMRIWLDPNKLNSVQMTAKDVTDAIESQNAQIAVGQLAVRRPRSTRRLTPPSTPSRCSRHLTSSAILLCA